MRILCELLLTSFVELMQSLNAMVTSGKVLYLGVSDTPAWVVSKANECMFSRLSVSPSECLLTLTHRRSQPRPPPILRLPRPLVRRLP